MVLRAGIKPRRQRRQPPASWNNALGDADDRIYFGGFGIRRDRPIASARQTRRACQHRSLRQALRRP
jgi:hypothetical protein